MRPPRRRRRCNQDGPPPPEAYCRECGRLARWWVRGRRLRGERFNHHRVCCCGAGGCPEILRVVFEGLTACVYPDCSGFTGDHPEEIIDPNGTYDLPYAGGDIQNCQYELAPSLTDAVRVFDCGSETHVFNQRIELRYNSLADEVELILMRAGVESGTLFVTSSFSNATQEPLGVAIDNGITSCALSPSMRAHRLGTATVTIP